MARKHYYYFFFLQTYLMADFCILPGVLPHAGQLLKYFPLSRQHAHERMRVK